MKSKKTALTFVVAILFTLSYPLVSDSSVEQHRR